MPLAQIGFDLLVLMGLWLTFVGWIAKPPAARRLEGIEEA